MKIKMLKKFFWIIRIHHINKHQIPDMHFFLSLCVGRLSVQLLRHYTLFYLLLGEENTLRRLYLATAEVRFMFSLSFRKLGLAFNHEYLCQFFINFYNQCQFWNPHDEQITNLPLIFKFNEEITEKIGNEKDETRE